MTSEGMGPADFAAITGNRNDGGFGLGNDAWLVLFILLLGWGGNRGFGGGYGGGSNFGGDGYGLYPWLNNSNQLNNGFQNQLLNDNITEIRSGVTSLASQLCSCCNEMQMAMMNGFFGVEQSANARQMANMQQAFAAQTAMNQGFNSLQSQLAQCCCDNRLATCQTQNIVQNEGNATRFADANNTRDLIENANRNTQSILDKLCQLELDGVKGQLAQAQRENVGLQNQLNMAALRESQTAQNAFIQQGFSNEVDQLYNRLNNCPVPTTPVYGRTPIFTCNGNQGCGCGCGVA